MSKSKVKAATYQDDSSNRHNVSKNKKSVGEMNLPVVDDDDESIFDKSSARRGSPRKKNVKPNVYGVPAKMTKLEDTLESKEETDPTPRKPELTW